MCPPPSLSDELQPEEALGAAENTTGDTAAEGGDNTDAPREVSYEERYSELQDQYLRLAADFENFRKRVQQERESLLKYGAENTVNALLPVLDNLDRANASLSENSDPKMLFQSFTMMSRQLLDALHSTGLKKIETTGQVFDPKFHEATSQVETDEVPENQIVTEVQCGFMLHDRVLRPAMVMVAVPKTSNPGPASLDSTTISEENPFAQHS